MPTQILENINQVGLRTNQNVNSTPEGSLKDCNNIIQQEYGIYKKRNALSLYLNNERINEPILRTIIYDIFMIVFTSSKVYYKIFDEDDNNLSLDDFVEVGDFNNDVNTIYKNDGVYYNYDGKIYKISRNGNTNELSVAVNLSLITPPSISIQHSVFDATANGFIEDNYDVAYRYIVKRGTSDSKEYSSAPCDRFHLYNVGAGNANVTLRIYNAPYLEIGDVVEIYRTTTIERVGNIDGAGDNMFLIEEHVVDQSDIDLGYFVYTDSTSNGNLGRPLYSNGSIENANYVPNPHTFNHIGYDSYIFYWGLQGKKVYTLTSKIDSTSNSDITITVDGADYNFPNLGTTISDIIHDLNERILSNTTFLEKVGFRFIERDGRFILTFESLENLDIEFSVNTGSIFDITQPAENLFYDNRLQVSHKNSIYTSLDNTIEVGEINNEIITVAENRGLLYIFKRDGVFILRGSNYPFSVEKIGSDRLLSTEGVISYRNSLYGFYDTGIIRIEGISFNSIDTNIENEMKEIRDLENNHVSVLTYSETEKLLILNIPSSETSTSFDYQYVLSFLTGEWTKWRIEGNYVHYDLGILIYNNNNHILIENKKEGTDFNVSLKSFALVRTSVDLLDGLRSVFFVTGATNFFDSTGLILGDGADGLNVPTINTMSFDFFGEITRSVRFTFFGRTYDILLEPNYRSYGNVVTSSYLIRQEGDSYFFRTSTYDFYVEIFEGITGSPNDVLRLGFRLLSFNDEELTLDQLNDQQQFYLDNIDAINRNGDFTIPDSTVSLPNTVTQYDISTVAQVEVNLIGTDTTSTLEPIGFNPTEIDIDDDNLVLDFDMITFNASSHEFIQSIFVLGDFSNENLYLQINSNIFKLEFLRTYDVYISSSETKNGKITLFNVEELRTNLLRDSLLEEAQMKLIGVIDIAINYNQFHAGSPSRFKVLKWLQMEFQNSNVNNLSFSLSTDTNIDPTQIPITLRGLRTTGYGETLYGENAYGGDPVGQSYERLSIPREKRRHKYLELSIYDESLNKDFQLTGFSRDYGVIPNTKK